MLYNKEGNRMEAGEIYEALLTIYADSTIESLISDICNHFNTDDMEDFLEGSADPENHFETYLTEDDIEVEADED